MKPLLLFLSCCVAILLSSTSTLLAAEWDQAKATAAATSLNEALQQILTPSGKPKQQPDAIEDRNLNAAVVDLEILQKDVARLADMLASGRDQNQTRAFKQKIDGLRGSIRDYTRNAVIEPEVQQLVEQAATLLDELNSYYE